MENYCLFPGCTTMNPSVAHLEKEVERISHLEAEVATELERCASDAAKKEAEAIHAEMAEIRGALEAHRSKILAEKEVAALRAIWPQKKEATAS